MENDILDSLNDLGYEGPLSDETAFSKALDGGPKSLEFTKLIHILAEELKTLLNLEETVNIMNDPDESSSFLLELSSFLKELQCPYKKLTTGHMSARLQTKEDCILLLDYLISELMAARMVNIDCPKEKPGSAMEIVVQETPTARDLKEILIALKFNKPPPNITPEMLFSKLETKLKDTIQKEGEKLVGKPLYNKALTEKDWKQLESAFSEMFEEYRLRRETLITRLECTIQSFEWSDRLKTKKDIIQSTYRPKREQLKVKPDVRLSDFLAARTSLLHVEKTSSANVRRNTQSEVNKVIIGQVPDRGGRPYEQQPPPPEMPSWQQQRSTGGGFGGGRGGGGGGRGGQGGGRGGRVQGGYNQGHGDQGRPQTTPGGFNQNRSTYQTYEVPPGGYSQGYNNQSGYNQSHQNQQYGGSKQSYDSMGGYNQGENTSNLSQLEKAVDNKVVDDSTSSKSLRKKDSVVGVPVKCVIDLTEGICEVPAEIIDLTDEMEKEAERNKAQDNDEKNEEINVEKNKPNNVDIKTERVQVNENEQKTENVNEENGQVIEDIDKDGNKQKPEDENEDSEHIAKDIEMSLNEQKTTDDNEKSEQIIEDIDKDENEQKTKNDNEKSVQMIEDIDKDEIEQKTKDDSGKREEIIENINKGGDEEDSEYDIESMSGDETTKTEMELECEELLAEVENDDDSTDEEIEQLIAEVKNTKDPLKTRKLTPRQMKKQKRREKMKNIRTGILNTLISNGIDQQTAERLKQLKPVKVLEYLEKQRAKEALTGCMKVLQSEKYSFPKKFTKVANDMWANRERVYCGRDAERTLITLKISGNPPLTKKQQHWLVGDFTKMAKAAIRPPSLKWSPHKYEYLVVDCLNTYSQKWVESKVRRKKILPGTSSVLYTQVINSKFKLSRPVDTVTDKVIDDKIRELDLAITAEASKLKNDISGNIELKSDDSDELKSKSDKTQNALTHNLEKVKKFGPKCNLPGVKLEKSNETNKEKIKKPSPNAQKLQKLLEKYDIPEDVIELEEDNSQMPGNIPSGANTRINSVPGTSASKGRKRPHTASNTQTQLSLDSQSLVTNPTNIIESDKRKKFFAKTYVIATPFVEGVSDSPSNLRGSRPNFDSPRPNFDSPRPNSDGAGLNFNSTRLNFDGPREGFDDPRSNFAGTRDSFDGQRSEFVGTRRSFDGPISSFVGTREGFDGPRSNFVETRESFGGPRSSFGGPRESFDNPRPSFGGIRGSFDGPVSNFGGTRGFDGPRSNFGGPTPNFDSRIQNPSGPRPNFSNQRPSIQNNMYGGYRSYALSTESPMSMNANASRLPPFRDTPSNPNFRPSMPNSPNFRHPNRQARF